MSAAMTYGSILSVCHGRTGTVSFFFKGAVIRTPQFCFPGRAPTPRHADLSPAAKIASRLPSACHGGHSPHTPIGQVRARPPGVAGPPQQPSPRVSLWTADTGRILPQRPSLRGCRLRGAHRERRLGRAGGRRARRAARTAGRRDGNALATPVRRGEDERSAPDDRHPGEGAAEAWFGPAERMPRMARTGRRRAEVRRSRAPLLLALVALLAPLVLLAGLTEVASAPLRRRTPAPLRPWSRSGRLPGAGCKDTLLLKWNDELRPECSQ